MANVDTATALGELTRSLPNERVAALNMANARHIGGGYARGAMAQEEDLCRVMPALVHQLRKRQYPLRADQAHFTTTLLARNAHYALLPQWQEVNVISSAMPCLRPGGALVAGTREWCDTVRLRIRAVLHAAVEERVENIILGAFGCGAFHNPAKDVAVCFCEVLRSEEFAGAFRRVVFAIVDPRPQDGGNLRTFERELAAGLIEGRPGPKSAAVLGPSKCAASR